MIENRKSDHIDICLNEEPEAEHNHFQDIQLRHHPLPKVDFDNIDTSTTLFGKKLEAPIVITAITGGVKEATQINSDLAKVCAEFGIGFGVGSQRAAIEKPELRETYEVVKEYDVPLVIGNIGAPQLIPQQGHEVMGVEDFKTAQDMIGADIMAVHFNYLQEVVQPEGDLKCEGVEDAIWTIAKEIPLLAKETGAGMDGHAAQQFKDMGFKGVDVGGMSGTSFAAVEMFRAERSKDLVNTSVGDTFWNWGIPTPASIIAVKNSTQDFPIMATGGLINGLDGVRAVVLGADAGGFAGTVLSSAVEGYDKLTLRIKALMKEFRAGMFLSGAANVEELKQQPWIATGEAGKWMNGMGYDSCKGWHFEQGYAIQDWANE